MTLPRLKRAGMNVALYTGNDPQQLQEDFDPLSRNGGRYGDDSHSLAQETSLFLTN